LHVISRKKLREFVQRHADAESALDAWFTVTRKAQWHDLTDVRQSFNSADLVDKWIVFNIRGNHYRLIAVINYQRGKVFIRHVLTHAEYDRGNWKLD
jgi:mRNA interferase HigB